MRVFFDTEFFDQGNKIDLISIGLVREDGATYYAENEDFHWGEVPEDHWIINNVRPHLEGDDALISPSVIADDLEEFCGDNPTFWGYFSSYDWVLLCALYGSMMQLPSGWPMRCRDVAQLAETVKADPFRMVPQAAAKHHALNDARWTKACFDWVVKWTPVSFS